MAVGGAQVMEEDLQRVAQATGAQVQTTVNGLNPKVLGTCETFQEQQVTPKCHVLHHPHPSCLAVAGGGFVIASLGSAVSVACGLLRHGIL